jgi:hypothetical protein
MKPGFTAKNGYQTTPKDTGTAYIRMQLRLGRGQPMVRTGCQYTFHARVRVAARERVHAGKARGGKTTSEASNSTVMQYSSKRYRL